MKNPRIRFFERFIIERSIRKNERIIFVVKNNQIGEELFFKTPSNENCDKLYSELLKLRYTNDEVKIDFKLPELFEA